MPQTCQKYEDSNTDDMQREIKTKTHRTNFSCAETRFTDGPFRAPEPQSAVSPGATKYPKVEVSAFSFRTGVVKRNFFLKWQPTETWIKTP